MNSAESVTVTQYDSYSIRRLHIVTAKGVTARQCDSYTF